MTNTHTDRIAAVRLQDKDPFPDLSNAIKNTYHSHINATDAEGAEELVRDAVSALIEEFDHRLVYCCDRIDQEWGGKAFKASGFEKISDTLQHTPRDDVDILEFYSATAIFPTKVTSRIEFPLDINALVKAIIPVVAENSEMPSSAVTTVLYKPAVLEQLQVVLEYVAERQAKAAFTGTKPREAMEDYAHSVSKVEQTSQGDTADRYGTLQLTSNGGTRSVEFTSKSFIITTEFTFTGKIVWEAKEAAQD